VLIQEQCTNFIASYDTMKKRKISGIGVGDLVFQALGHFKVAKQMKSFSLVHCWMTIKDSPKWQELYAS
jgi:hypothetical protein